MKTASHVEKGRRLDIQGLRGIAVIMVVLYHADLPVTGGFTGVDVFFVISGFVITALLARELAETGAISFRRFYARRIRRLLPALALVGVATAIGSLVIHAPLGTQQTAGRTGVATSLFIANMEIWWSSHGYFATGTDLNPLLHMWSLGVEEQYYLLFPASLAVLWRLGRTRGRWLSAAGLAIAVPLSFGLCLALTDGWRFGRRATTFAFYSLPTRAWEFGLGALLALTAPLLGRAAGAVRVVAGLAGIVLLVVASVGIDGRTSFPGAAALIPAGASACLIFCGMGSGNVVSRALAVRPLAYLGDVSYGWYLWHWPAVVFTKVLATDHPHAVTVAAFGSLLPAAAMARWFENPMRHTASSRGYRVVALSGVCVLVPAAVSAGLYAGAQRGWGNPEVSAYAEQRADLSMGRRTRCLINSEFRVDLLSRCYWTVQGAKGYVLLLGDSHAGSLMDGVLEATQTLGYDLQAAPGSSCPFTARAPLHTNFVSNCGELYQTMLRRATQDPTPALVVMTHFTYAYIAELERRGASDPTKTWGDALRAPLRALRDARVPVLMVHDVPLMGQLSEPCRFGAVFDLECGTDRGILDNALERAHALEREVGGEFSNVTLLDVTDTFCDRESCSPIRNGVMLYSDNQHLNARGSLLIAPALEDAMRRALATPGR